MSQTSLPPDIAQLSVAERILLVEQIWDSIAEEEEAVPLSKAQREEIERRLDADEASPDDVVPWEDIQNEYRAKK